MNKISRAHTQCLRFEQKFDIGSHFPLQVFVDEIFTHHHYNTRLASGVIRLVFFLSLHFGTHPKLQMWRFDVRNRSKTHTQRQGFTGNNVGLLYPGLLLQVLGRQFQKSVPQVWVHIAPICPQPFGLRPNLASPCIAYTSVMSLVLVAWKYTMVPLKNKLWVPVLRPQICCKNNMPTQRRTAEQANRQRTFLFPKPMSCQIFATSVHHVCSIFPGKTFCHAIQNRPTSNFTTQTSKWCTTLPPESVDHLSNYLP